MAEQEEGDDQRTSWHSMEPARRSHMYENRHSAPAPLMIEQRVSGASQPRDRSSWQHARRSSSFSPSRRPVSLPPRAMAPGLDDPRRSRVGDLFLPPVGEAPATPGQRHPSSETTVRGDSSPGRSSNKERESLVKGGASAGRLSATGVFESRKTRGRARDGPKGWHTARTRKQRRCLVCGLGLAALLLLAAVGGIVAGVLVSKHRDDKSDFVGGSGGGESTGKSGVGSASGGNPNSTAPATTGGEQAEQRGGKYGYDAFVVFGASYCDNAHKRKAQYAASLKNPPYWEGRWSNGPVWDEILAETLSPNGTATTLVNYAYGGAAINNSVTPEKVPDLSDQVAAFLSDVTSGSLGAAVSKGKILFGVWIGINTVSDVWTQSLRNLSTAKTPGESTDIISVASTNITESIATMASVINGLATSSAFAVAPDFLILPLPPAQDLLSNQQTAHGDKDTLTAVAGLNDQFNLGLNNTISALNRTFSSSSSQRVFTYPIYSWFDGLATNPTAHNLTVSDRPCYNGTTVCTDPDTYLFWDLIHVVTTIHARLAASLAQVISSY